MLGHGVLRRSEWRSRGVNGRQQRRQRDYTARRRHHGHFGLGEHVLSSVSDTLSRQTAKSCLLYLALANGARGPVATHVATRAPNAERRCVALLKGCLSYGTDRLYGRGRARVHQYLVVSRALWDHLVSRDGALLARVEVPVQQEGLPRGRRRRQLVKERLSPSSKNSTKIQAGLIHSAKSRGCLQLQSPKAPVYHPQRISSRW